MDEEEGGTRRKDVRGGRRDGEEGGMGRKEGRGGRREKESKEMKKIVKKRKNEKVARGRIVDPRGLVFT